MSSDLNKLLRGAIRKATTDFRKEKKTTSRRETLSRSARKRLYTRHYAPLSIKAAAFQVMEEAYLKASANNTLPANARQIMYQARPLIQNLTTKMWKNSSLFTQTYLPAFLRENPGLAAKWDVVYDARGHFEEPHTEKKVALGTLAVRDYIVSWAENIALPRLSKIEPRVVTCGPANRYRFALFIEKEGFSPLLERSQIASRYDIAIMSTKGMSVTASRALIESLSAVGVTTLVAHDFDIAGFTIYRTLRESTTRYTFRQKPRVHYLGLRLSDVREMGLESESVDLESDPTHELRRCGASDEEVAFLGAGERVELNAMDSGQFVAWLERKLAEHSVTKIVPSQQTLETAFKRSVLVRRANEALEALQEQWEADNEQLEIPDNLEARVRSIITGSALAWDQAIDQLSQD